MARDGMEREDPTESEKMANASAFLRSLPFWPGFPCFP